MTALGDRMKSYEDAVGPVLLRRTPVIIRVDGKAFHTFTKRITPETDFLYQEGHFSPSLHGVMTRTAIEVCKEMQNVVLAYTQSDEISFLLKDWNTHDTQQWFDGKVQKIVSVTAAMITAHFNKLWPAWFEGTGSGLALFDARAFNVPLQDVDNYFVWRQRDMLRNSVSFIARQYFSHKQLHGKNRQQVIEMLANERGVNWNSYPLWEQRGSCIVKHPTDSQQGWIIDDDIPIFQEDREYIMSKLVSEE
jgi:tRNA(His) 5'-end guanylyltransferase